MIRRIVGWSLKSRLIVVVVAAGLMLFGITQLRNMPVDALPEFTPPRVEVQIEALGLSATEVEQLITVPLEEELLNGVAWLDTIRSESLPGLSRIELIFEPGTDLMRARQVVQERLIQAPSLPTAKVSNAPQMLQPLSSTSRVMMIGVSSKRHSLIETSVLARWNIRPRLMGVPGVANVAIWGQRERQLQVQVDPEHLQNMDVSLLQVIRTAGNSLWVSPLSFLEASTPGSGGFFDTPNQRLGIRHVSPIVTPRDLAQVAVEGADNAATGGQGGEQLRLGDVANVVENHQPLIGDAIGPGGPQLLLVVEKFPWANAVDVTHDVEAALKAMKPGLAGVQFDLSIFRPATFIESAIANSTVVLLIALLLVVLLIAAFFLRWRTALIALVTIPLSLMAAGLVLYLRDMTINTMVLAGLVLALGVLIDDAVADTETIMQRLRQRREEGSDKSSARIILEASFETRRPIIYGTIILLLAVVPLFFMGGVIGAFFRPMVITYALAVLVSMLVALTVTPALSLMLFKRAVAHRESPLVGWLQRRYQAALSRTIDKPRRALLAAGAVVLAGILAGFAVFPQLGQSLLPSFQERDILVHLDGAPGTSHPEISRITARVSDELRSISGVQNVGIHVGRAVMSDEAVNVNSSELWVSVGSDADYDSTVAAIEEAIDGYPGLSSDVLTYQNERVREALSGVASGDLAVRVYGQDLATLRQKAEEVSRALSGIDGVTDTNVEAQAVEPTVEIEVNLAAAQAHGIKPGDVRRAAATLLAGINVGQLFEDQKVFDVVVWGTPETRHSLSSARDLLIDTPDGEQVRLGEVADIAVRPNPNVIRREAVSRLIDVGATVRGRSVGAVAEDVDAALQQIDFPLEYHAEILGEYAERQAAQARMGAFGIAAAIGILLLLQAAFGSWRLASIAFMVLPLSLIGGVVALFLSGNVISLGSIIGFFTVFAIAARNSIVTITRYQHLQWHEDVAFGPDLVLRGAGERLVPILMTTLATGLAFSSFVLAGDIAGQEIVHPMAMVALGGLITSTLLNLFVVPFVYLRFGYSPEPSTTAEVDLDMRPADAAV